MNLSLRSPRPSGAPASRATSPSLRYLRWIAFLVGLVAVCWVGGSYVGGSLVGLVVTLLVAGFYLMGALELRRFDADTDAFAGALDDMRDAPADASALGLWLERVPATLRNAVRLRIEGERVGLPGPALTPYLAGLLVLLGMLGTFLGMVVTLNGTGSALESASDLLSIRASLAAPVKGLGLAFGTSLAGVATSAMLGLMSALCRRDRMQAAHALDTRIATTLRGFSIAHRRDESFKLLQLQADQAAALPALVDGLQRMMDAMTQQHAALGERLVAGQDGFHSRTETSYAALATSVDHVLKKSLLDSARMAAETIQPIVQATMAGIAQEASALHARVDAGVREQVEGLAVRFDATTAHITDIWQQGLASLQDEVASQDERRRAEAAELITELRQKLSDSMARDNAVLEERSRIMQTLENLLDAVNRASNDQRNAIDQLVAASNAMLADANARFATQVDAQVAKMDATAGRVADSTAEVATVGERFGDAVLRFGESNDRLGAQLQRIEGALGQSMARSDEQLAYYVAQAREVVDLSILSQKQIVEDLQRLAAASEGRARHATEDQSA